MNEGRIDIRTATEDDLPAVMNVIDGALLATDASTVAEQIRRGRVFVAVDSGSVLGACVLQMDGCAHVEAIAVRPRRRRQGIGRLLVEAAAARLGRLTTDFDERAFGFYHSLGFEIEPDGDRYRGVLQP